MSGTKAYIGKGIRDPGSRPAPRFARDFTASPGMTYVKVIPEFADLSAVALAKVEGEYPGSVIYLNI